jgi:hypothetical protein
MRAALKDRIKRRHGKRAAMDAAQTLSVAAQMALLCPAGIDVWMQRELAGGSRQSPPATASRR